MYLMKALGAVTTTSDRALKMNCYSAETICSIDSCHTVWVVIRTYARHLTFAENPTCLCKPKSEALGLLPA